MNATQQMSKAEILAALGVVIEIADDTYVRTINATYAQLKTAYNRLWAKVDQEEAALAHDRESLERARPIMEGTDMTIGEALDAGLIEFRHPG